MRYNLQNILLADYFDINTRQCVRGQIIGFRFDFKITRGYLHAFSRTICIKRYFDTLNLIQRILESLSKFKEASKTLQQITVSYSKFVGLERKK
jgi:hypothetical protein